MQQLLEMLTGQQNQSNLNDIMNQFGLDEHQARQAVGSLLPGVSQGIQRQVQAQNSSILEQIAQAQQQPYLDDDNVHVYEQQAVEGGNSILGQIFGSKDVSREVAQQASQQTGLDNSLLKQLLPMVASMAMGSLGKQANQQGIQQSQGGIMDLVGSMIDTQGDGVGLDDIMNVAKKFMR